MTQKALKECLSNSIEGIKANPAMANAVFKAEVKLQDDVHCTAKVRDFHLDIDEPPELGGQNKGMNPVEMLLASLGACQEIVYAAYASMMDIKLEELKVSVKGDLDLHGIFSLNEDTPSVFQNISFETHIKSDADPEKVKQLMHLAESHCPVMDTLTRRVPVTGDAYLNSEKISE